ncbi:30S ribosome-binding factor RbfA [Mucisphaera calidilacus]|uniref:Ribosome-binding factor A n=1 Tax=Mucisphaera calidilacus TaxID=2527982 RepID=A0A518BW61_9BACT|nr:30S ribosome-binding factor RbfA [Mucisphaera calidilacus]QDU71219.1 Ribosome-binding factor A [Mucisphaera calidilacus]
MSHRIEQIASMLRRAISEVIQREISDPRVTGLTSITRIDVTPDLAEAFVYVSVLPEEHATRSVAGLNHASRHIHDGVIRRVSLRHVPKLRFRLDQSLKKQAEVLDAIRVANERTGPENGPDDNPDP